MTEVNIQEWGLELSAPNPLGQPRRHDVQCVWRTCAPPSCYCSYYTGTKANKYSVNIALVFFQVTFFLLFSVLSFSEWLEVFLLHLMFVIRLSWKALRLVTKISSESCHNILKHATYQENLIIISLHTIMLSHTKFGTLTGNLMWDTIGPFIRGKIRRVLNKTRTVPFIRACLI